MNSIIYIFIILLIINLTTIFNNALKTNHFNQFKLFNPSTKSKFIKLNKYLYYKNNKFNIKPHQTYQLQKNNNSYITTDITTKINNSLNESFEIDNFFLNEDKITLANAVVNYEKKLLNSLLNKFDDNYNDDIFDNEPEIDDSKPLFCVIGNKNKITKNLLYDMKYNNIKFLFFPKILFSKEDLEDVFGFNNNSIVRIYKNQQLIGDLFDMYDQFIIN